MRLYDVAVDEAGNRLLPPEHLRQAEQAIVDLAELLQLGPRLTLPIDW